INDFSSIRFIRMFLTGFEKPIVLRFGSFDLVRGEWRIYEQPLDNSANTGTMTATGVNIEENNDKSPVNYILPPGIRREQDPTQPQLVESNEQALAITVDKLSTNESKAVYKNSYIDMRQYKRLQMFVHANADENNVTNLRDKDLAVFVRLGSDYKNNYYEYEIPLTLTAPGHYDRYSATDKAAVWPQENMLNIPLTALTNLKKERNKAKSQGIASYNQPFTAYDQNNPNNKMTVVGNPSLGEVKTMMIGVRNLANGQKSGEVWVNELRLLEYDNSGGWAAQGNLNVQLSDLGTVNMQGRIINDGFGGLEDGVAQRAQEKTKGYTFTTNLELGKFFPDKAKVSMPLYYSISEENVTPKYNPLDTDLNLADALESMEKHERDSIESIAVTKTKNTNFSLSNVRVSIATKKHPMPYDPANFSFSYSHSHRHSTGETTVFENENNWRGSLNYSYTPVYKPFEPFKKMKGKSKYLDILKRFGLNWLPQTITFNTDMVRNYYELQERDMEDLGGQGLPLTFNEQFLWNREFSIRWDLTKNLHASFNSATHAQIEEPYTPINKDLYPDQYTAWKDSVWQSIRNLGTPLDYQQNFTASYQLPLNLMPCFAWLTADASYNATYSWQRGTELEDGTSLGNTIANSRRLNINSQFNLEKLYNLVPFLKKTNERFNKTTTTKKPSSTAKNNKNTQDKANNKSQNKDNSQQSTANNQQSKAFQQEIKIYPDSFIVVKHNKKSKRLIVSGKTEDGKQIALKYKRVDDNTIKVSANVDTIKKVKVSVLAKEPLENQGWYKTAQVIARGLMMVRNVSLTYRNQYNMSLPGFMPNAGDIFGQRNAGALAPGLDFAFGLTGDDFINKAAERDWLLMNDSVATPAASSRTTDLQLRATVEPVKNFKIDLNASRTETRSQSVQYMYQNMPTTRTGTFTMTTISLGSAFESTGNIENGFHSATFEKFCNSLEGFRNRVENQYIGSTYPNGTRYAGEKFDPAKGGVNKYSADVL
ncbi:MAG: cell surface protein SprA, partial [Bacteroidaceae bacterium]|nr:cell surface protein SprA [Bacteroidaceae bacterium]